MPSIFYEHSWCGLFKKFQNSRVLKVVETLWVISKLLANWSCGMIGGQLWYVLNLEPDLTVILQICRQDMSYIPSLSVAWFKNVIFHRPSFRRGDLAMYASVGGGLGAPVPPPLKTSRKEKAKAPQILEVKLAEPPQEDSQSRGRAQLPSHYPGELLPPDFGVRDLATSVASNMGVSTHFVICDRHGPIVDSEATRGEVILIIDNSDLLFGNLQRTPRFTEMIYHL